MPVQKYIPLNVSTVKQSWQRLRGILCVALFAFITSLLCAVYQLFVLAPGDRDWRDMLFDYRITSAGVSYYHQYFVLGLACCNNDPEVFSYTCPVTIPASGAVCCPPTIVYTCSLNTCPLLRRYLYPAAGYYSDGRVRDCSIAGSVLLSKSAEPTISLSVDLTVVYNGTTYPGLQIPNIVKPDLTAIQQFVQTTMNTYKVPGYVPLSAPLQTQLTVNNQQVYFITKVTGPTRNIKTWPPWSSFLWPWPGFQGRCQNTGSGRQFYLEGLTTINLPIYDPSTLQMATVQFANSTKQVSIYQLMDLYPNYDNDQIINIPYGNDVGTVGLGVLSNLQIQVGMVPTQDSCNGWYINNYNFTASYTTIWSGPVADLYSSFDVANATNITSTEVPITVRDVSAPAHMNACYMYSQRYIILSLLIAWVWALTLGPVLLVAPLLTWWTITRNRGLPPPFYWYMEKYRGW